MDENAAQQDSKKRFPATNILLGFLMIAVIWLSGEVAMLNDKGSVYIQNSDNGYALLKTTYGNFPVGVSETKPVKDGTEITLTIVNPLVIQFRDAKIGIEAQGSTETKSVTLDPSINTVKFKVAPLNRGDEIRIFLDLDKIAFK